MKKIFNFIVGSILNLFKLFFGRKYTYLILKNIILKLLVQDNILSEEAIVLLPFENNSYIRYIPKYNFYICLDPTDRDCGLYIAKTGEWEKNILNVMKKYVKPGGNFLDIGANLGFYSLFAITQLGQKKVYAFEPDKRNFELLSNSIIINKFQNKIIPYNKALNESDCELILTNLGNIDNSGSRFVSNNKSHLDKYIHGPKAFFDTVESVSLNNFLPNIDFEVIKIDIEGYELKALCGMDILFDRCKPLVFCEFAPTNLHDIGKTTPEELLNFFFTKNYEVMYIDEIGKVTNFNQDIKSLIQFHKNTNKHHSDLLFIAKK